jgi:hypothetical protein
MALGAVAVKAVKWLIRAFTWYRRRNDDVKMVLGVMKSLGVASKQLDKVTTLLEKAERTVGSQTDAWGKIKRAKKDRAGLTLTAADVRYLYVFKKAFDIIKKPFRS